MPISEKPKELEIHSLIVYQDAEEHEYYRIGDLSGVTKIELFELPGPYCMLPYIRVWKGDKIYAEYPRHQCIGIRYKVD